MTPERPREDEVPDRPRTELPRLEGLAHVLLPTIRRLMPFLTPAEAESAARRLAGYREKADDG